jgi:two-component system response regulator AtoC
MTTSEDTRRTILVGEDDAEIRNYLKVMLSCRGYTIQAAADGDEVIRYLHTGLPVTAILLDIMMPNKDGFDTLREIREISEDVPVIMLSAASSPTNVVQAIKGGATDFLAKPVDHEDLVRAIERAVQVEGLPSTPWQYMGADEMFFGSHPAMCELKACLPRVARSDVPVLIQGETGTGKEVLSRHIHELSSRSGRPFLKLNCAAVPSDLMESELFGYERGAFTGAFERKLGLFELADGGTILLDEIGDMDIRLQAKLLQVLQDHEFRRLGGKNNVRVHVRIIAATHQNLQEAIREGKFRDDLFYRLNVFTLTVPPLRERQDDILGITEFLIQKHSSRQTPSIVLTPRLKEALLAFEWPGNIRQLENIVRKLMVMREPDAIISELETIALGGKIQLAPRPEHGTPISLSRKKAISDPASRLEGALLASQQAEVEAILDALQSTRWNRKQAAARLNIEYKALLYKMKKLSIEERATKLSLPA